MKLLITSLSLLGFTSCAISLTAPYDVYSDSSRLGYVDVKNGDQTDSARFHGNLFTEPVDLVLFSQFRAVQVCQSRGKALTRILKMTDKSPSSSIQSAEGYRNHVPPYLKYDVSFNATPVREGTIDGSIDPIFETTYMCVDAAYSLQVNVRELVSGEVKAFVQDARGAVQVDTFQDTSVSTQALKVDDIILKVNGARAKTRNDFYRLVDMAPNGKTVLNIVRERQIIDVEIQAADISKSVEAFELRVVRAACKKEEFKNQPSCLK